jgi:glycyl-tRNA synthetase (class II)
VPNIAPSCHAGNTVGKRYARTDEIGVPYAVTVDFQTLEGEGVTLRERDTMTQVRCLAGVICLVTATHLGMCLILLNRSFVQLM